jgi:hypothetical protein
MDMTSGKTCITCAKAKIKCDKMLPKCSRCVRLGIDCLAQARGRGRPKAQPQPQLKETLPRPAVLKKTSPSKNLMLIESIKAALQDVAQKGPKGEVLVKCIATTKWLFHIACCTKSEQLYDEVLNIWEVRSPIPCLSYINLVIFCLHSLKNDYVLFPPKKSIPNRVYIS